jgi:hypothetical protein
MFLPNDELPKPSVRQRKRKSAPSSPRPETSNHRFCTNHPNLVVSSTPTIRFTDSEVRVIFDRHGLSSEQIQCLDELKDGLEYFSKMITFLKDHLLRINKFDSQLEGITKSVAEYSSSIYIQPLDDEGIVLRNRASILNRMCVLKLCAHAFRQNNCTPSRWFGTALTIYFLHEISHDSQGFGRYQDVQQLKKINQHDGRSIFTALDLRSDYLAGRMFSLLETLKLEGSYNQKTYHENLYFSWCKVSRGMLDLFATRNTSRKDKIRRTFGYLLMGICIKNTYHQKSPFILDSELVPNWSRHANMLSIKFGEKYWISGEAVDCNLMRKIQRLILKGDYDLAENSISDLWYILPKR